ncbi:unnamed protein product [Haemonchus placei]|uniref:WD_REPEATS_REGION domain-containing protein n=1 Tax=Haemonchus placei TaxID=6290 RepID=A0A158QRQ6_HAEPC|nr:unnamed protein product [Haemonchus placei]
MVSPIYLTSFAGLGFATVTDYHSETVTAGRGFHLRLPLPKNLLRIQVKIHHQQLLNRHLRQVIRQTNVRKELIGPVVLYAGARKDGLFICKSDSESSDSGEEVRDDLERTIMENVDDVDDVQILDENVEPPSSNARGSPSDSDSEVRMDLVFAGYPRKELRPPRLLRRQLVTTRLTMDVAFVMKNQCKSIQGKNAVCPTCKTKTNLKDVRKHYTATVKVTDTTEVEMLRNSNAALHIRISGLEVELAKKDRELAELAKKLQEGKSADSSSSTPQIFVQQRGGRMFMNPERKEALAVGGLNADARAMDFNGEVWAVGVACSQARNIFSPFGIRILTIVSHKVSLPLGFSDSISMNSGGEDKRAIISMEGAIRRQWRMPNEKPVWTGCWTAANKVALGLGDGRVLEYAVDSDSTEPIRDYTQGVGHLPIIFTGFDPVSTTLLVASFKKLVAFRNDRVFPLLSNVDDNFDKMRSISFDETSLHFAVTFLPGGRHPGISHRLYRLEIDDDNDEVRCIEMAQWLTDCQMSSTMWTNCLFSLKNSLFSVVYNEDRQRFDAHDWSGRRADAMIHFPSSATVAAIRAIPAGCDTRKTIIVLADKAIFSIAFGLSDVS